MKDFPIPVVAPGPGSQTCAADEGLDYLVMPRGMATFDPPRLPEADDPMALAEALAVLRELLAALRGWTFATTPNPCIDVAHLGPSTRRLVNEALGQGEVSAVLQGDRRLRIQETVFAGVWRVLELDADGRVLADRIEATLVPAVIAEQARARARPELTLSDPPPEVMNAPALLAELHDVASGFRLGDAAHVINLTLLPLTVADLEHLTEVLGEGSAVVLSRGYGNCRVSSTALANTWWVRYYNSSDALILGTIEVTDMPDIVPAAAEDLTDSIGRLAAWIDALETA